MDAAGLGERILITAEPLVLERAHELTEFEEACERARQGRGSTILIEAPAGTGKSTLLQAATDGARGSGMRCIAARGGELEQEFPFGVIRQLFEGELTGAAPEQRSTLLAGSAAPAEQIMAEVPGHALAGGLGAVHALYWLTVNLASERPLLIAVDDAHWADASSLRAIAYLARRLAEVPVVLAVAMRPDEAAAHAELFDALRADPDATFQRLHALGPESVAALVRDRLPHAPDAVCEACHAQTGGNPLYLQELLRTISAAGAPQPATAETIREAAIASLGDRVMRRVARVDGRAPALAKAMAVLGDRGSLALAGRLAGLSLEEAGNVARRLRRIEVISPEDPFAFVHPLVRSSVYDSLAAPERDAAHASAAALLEAAGAPAQAVAAHLAHLPPAGSPSVVATLLRAAADAIKRAAVDEAIRWLSRALEEDDPQSRAEVLTRLGAAERMALDPNSIPHLREAYDLAADPNGRAHAAAIMADSLFLVARWTDAMTVVERAIAERDAIDRALLTEMTAIGVLIAAYVQSLELSLPPDRVEELLEGDGWAPKALAAVLAGVTAHRGDGAGRVRALVDRALARGQLFEERDAGGWAGAHVLIALIEIDDHARAIEVSEELSTVARRTGSVNGQLTAADHRAWAYARRGDLVAADAELRPGLERAFATGAPTVLASTFFYMQEVLLERSGTDDLAARVEDVDIGPVDGSYMEVMLRTARGRLRLASGDRAAGIEDLEGGLEISAALDMGPAVSPIRSLLALALPSSDRERALGLVADELRLARDCGLPRPEAVALRAAGLLAAREEGIQLLQRSVELLEPLDVRLELARSLVELGAALRRAGRRAEARDRLAAGTVLARRCGADRLAARAAEEARAAGARQRNGAGDGHPALTASELRVARLAAAGAGNQEIAERLFVTLKTVESHLYSAYRKLGLSGRGSRARLAKAIDA